MSSKLDDILINYLDTRHSNGVVSDDHAPGKEHIKALMLDGLNSIAELVQEMREDGEGDLRSVLYIIEAKIKEVEAL